MPQSQDAFIAEQKAILMQIYHALLEQGYEPIRQITGYLLSEDPTYIPDHKNARALATKIDRELLLSVFVGDFLRE